ncbi:DNA polymerase III, delta prime subunit [Candidatus Electrothrix marina]|uniref:DNA polymerase III, delta prime subunit n=1 Tax=Candidatus Electrothrix marina TaxID=1859130 RepID=A0A444JDW6_9BACT|nr:DNA polymerase III, delta prime subunit [Candidatus Electrothrix marina]
MPFSSIIGQPKAVNLLTRALNGNRLAHGYLFVGPEGVGKTTTARALAAHLFCQTAEASSPCGHCSGCIKVSSGNHPDLLIIRPEGAGIKIQQIRELKKSLSFPPFEAELRIIIIEETQTMKREAGNSLLKILEEPPPNNLLLLVAADSEPLLDTIVSRCQVIPFMALPVEQAVAIIQRNHPEFATEEAEALAKLTGGCPGQAGTLYNDEVLLLHKECIRALSAENGTRAESLEQALFLAGRLAELKDGLDQLFDLLALSLKENMIALLSENKKTDPDVPSAAREGARERWNLQRLSAMVDAVDAARRQLARNCNRALVCEVLLLELFA